MTGPSKWQRETPPSGSKSRSFGVGYMVACLALYALAMAGVRFCAKEIGVVGGLLTIVGMYIAARWYDRQSSVGKVITANIEVTEDDSVANLSPEVSDEHASSRPSAPSP